MFFIICLMDEFLEAVQRIKHWCTELASIGWGWANQYCPRLCLWCVDRHIDFQRLVDFESKQLGRTPLSGGVPRWSGYPSLTAMLHQEKLLLYRNAHIEAEVRKCANELKEAMHGCDNVILAPLHYYSDYMAAAVAALATDKRINLLSVYENNGYERKFGQCFDGLIGRANQRDPLARSSAEAAKVLRSFTDSKKTDQEQLVVFPDITPEYSCRITGKYIKYQKVQLFGRGALMHPGVFRLAKITGMDVLVFLIFYKEGNIYLHIVDRISPEAITDALPRAIEAALKRYPENWLLWNYTSFYYFNPYR